MGGDTGRRAWPPPGLRPHRASGVRSAARLDVGTRETVSLHPVRLGGHQPDASSRHPRSRDRPVLLPARDGEPQPPPLAGHGAAATPRTEQRSARSARDATGSLGNGALCWCGHLSAWCRDGPLHGVDRLRACHTQPVAPRRRPPLLESRAAPPRFGRCRSTRSARASHRDRGWRHDRRDDRRRHRHSGPAPPGGSDGLECGGQRRARRQPRPAHADRVDGGSP